MNVSISQSQDGIDWTELATVFERAPLGARDPDKLKRAFEKSFRVCIAFYGPRLIGAARMISDGEYYAGIYDVVVLPEYQQRGIGTKLMAALLDGLSIGTIFPSKTEAGKLASAINSVRSRIW